MSCHVLSSSSLSLQLVFLVLLPEGRGGVGAGGDDGSASALAASKPHRQVRGPRTPCAPPHPLPPVQQDLVPPRPRGSALSSTPCSP
eukprot:768385-Hanusia_phi.AAC.5